ncbi:hypothetical protein DKX38_010068 [Salix brachista]|uniref:DUF4283 domain-containing protein n=1 Tax=Salix brachista TaxID=2182728 RepID=A0A5N5MCH5_9ROSI|nr:hypothetical protein DKX38_010068 [Salix brachista]
MASHKENPILPQPLLDKKEGRDTPQATWADRVRVTDSSTRHTLDPIPQQPAGSRLKIPTGMKLLNVDQWSRCMIGFFTGCRLPYHAVNLIARKVWGPYGLEQVLTMEYSFLIFRFKSEESVLEVMEKGPWMFGGKNTILQKWTPQFHFERSKIAHVSVWIRLRGLPLPLWTRQGLSMAASMVGKPQSCDGQTITCKRLDYARLCVELDARLPFIHHFEVESPLTQEPEKVNVEYKWKPSCCEVCQSFGHKCVMQEPTPVVEGRGKAEVDDQTQRQGRPMMREKHQHKRDASHKTRPEEDKQLILERPLRREGKQPMADASPTRSPMQKLHGQQVAHSIKQARQQVDKTDAGDEASSGDSHTLTAGDDNIRTVPIVRKKKKGRNKNEARGL